MVEKPSLAVQLSDREPTVDTQGVEVYNEKGIECQPMGKKQDRENQMVPSALFLFWRFFHFLDGPNGLCGIVSNGFCMWFPAPK